MFETVKTMHDVLWSSPLMMVMCAASIGYLIYRSVKKQERKTLEICLLFTALTGVLVCLNPIVATVITRFTGDPYTFVRFTWLLPLFALMAYAATLLIMDVSGRKRWIVLAVILGLVVSSGEPWPQIIIPSENIYKISDSLKDACDAIRSDAGEGRVTVNVFLPANNIYEDGSAANMRYFGVRQYAPEFMIDYTTLTPGQYEDENFSYEEHLLNRGRYIICDKNANIARELGKVGYEPLAETSDLAVYKNTMHLNLVFIRHGQTQANVDEVVVGIFESPLTDTGIKQAKAAGEGLKGLHVDRAYSSPVERTQQTARYALDGSGNEQTDIIPCMGLRDLNWGLWENHSWAEIEEAYGTTDIHTLLGAVEDGAFDTPVTDADTMAQYCHGYDIEIHRVLTSCYVDGLDDGTILVAGHSIAAQWLRTILPDTPVPDGLQNAGITILQYDAGEWRAVTIDNTDYDDVQSIVGTL